MKIKNVYDNGGATWDRYTIFIEDEDDPDFAGFGSSVYPNMPCSYFQTIQKKDVIEGSHLGKKIQFTDLPDEVQEKVNGYQE